MDHAPDSPLLDAARRGDRGALGRLLRLHEPRLYHVCLRMVRHRDDAAELTQDTLVKTIQHLDTFRGDAQLATWMTRIAINLCLSHLRKRKVRRAASLDAPTPHPSDHQGKPATPAAALADHREPTPASRVQLQEDADQLQHALDQLEPDHRAVLLLRDLQQLDYAHIGQVLDCPVGTVKSRLFRARLKLREALTQPPPPNRPLATPSPPAPPVDAAPSPPATSAPPPPTHGAS